MARSPRLLRPADDPEPELFIVGRAPSRIHDLSQASDRRGAFLGLETMASDCGLSRAVSPGMVGMHDLRRVVYRRGIGEVE